MTSSATKTKFSVTLIFVDTPVKGETPYNEERLMEEIERMMDLPAGLSLQYMKVKKHAPMPKIGPRLPGTKSAPKVR
jgi:hypothetical protein